MAKKKEPVVLVKGDDWQGLYVGGKLYTEGHKITASDLAGALGYEHFFVEAADVDWLADEGNFPENIEEVVWEEKPGD